jgi:hypothetical protein
VTVFRGEYIVRTLYPGLLSVAVFGLMLGCLGGLCGCDSKPGDGTVVATEAKDLTPEQRAIHQKGYADRHKKAGTTGGRP